MAYHGIKFKVIFQKKKAPNDKRLKELKRWCAIFHEKKLAPPYDCRSYGNLSFRIKKGENGFIITGSKIGLKNKLKNNSFVAVLSCSLEKKEIYAEGLRDPSSESMLHYAIYKSRPDINAIFHGHGEIKFSRRQKVAKTKKEAPYGTIQLVEEVLKVLSGNNIIIMKNHGFIALGKNMDSAGRQCNLMIKS